MKHLSMKLLSEIVVSRRKALKLSQIALSQKANINRSILSRLEAQDYSPSVDQLLSLCSVLGFHDVHSRHVIVLGQQNCKGKADVACSGHSNLFPLDRLDFCFIIHNDIGRLETKDSAEGKKLVYRRAVVLCFKP